ncbi:ankyrin repeat-containing domain protein [Aspergillus carlsbadensis]|nr:ankyrin repeat-containing domain protein [Aspergillus carlsbadensis]
METYSAMIEAIMTPHASVEMVQILIDRGADVNGQHRMEWTPLVQAVVNNKLEIAQLLLENGADPNLPSARPMPLDMAIRRGTAAMAQLFRGYGTLTPYEACTVGSSSQREPPSGTSNLSETASTPVPYLPPSCF